jgi:hypothetical protein
VAQRPPRIPLPVAATAMETVVATVAAAIVYIALDGASMDARRVAAVLIPLAALAMAGSWRTWPWGLGSIVAGWFIAGGAMYWCIHSLGQQLPVSQAVGGAAFSYTPYRGGQIGAVVSVALPALIALGAVAAAWWSRRGSKAQGPPNGLHRVADSVGTRTVSEPKPASGVRALRSTWPLWLGVVVLIFTLVPNLSSYLVSEATPLPYGWDTSNLISWQGFVEQGLVPMKDFFYPYGFQYLYNLRSFGPVFQWLAQIAMLGIGAWALWRLTARSMWRVLIGLLSVILIGAWSPELWRYFPAMLITFTYAALDPLGRSRSWVDRAMFGAACLLAALIEPDLVASGLLGVVLVVVGQLVAGELTWRSGRLLTDALIDAVPVILTVIVLVVIWLARGTTAGNIRFFTEFSAVSAQSAPSEWLYGPLGLMNLSPNAYTIAALAPALLAIAGLTWAWGYPRDRAGRDVLLGGSGVGVALLLKNFVRPIGDIELLPTVVALSWAVVIVWRWGSMVRVAACAAALGALACLVDESASATSYLNSAIHSPSTAVDSIRTAFNRGARVRAADAEFSPQRFSGWPDEEIANWLLAADPGHVPSFAIFGDSAMTYVLLRQRPPFQVDMYDAGRIAEQRVMLADLERKPPQFMVYRFDFAQDGIPYDIRDPLVFAWMMRNYVPVASYPIADILRRRSPGEPIAAAYWTKRLGALVDLEYIPSVSSALGSPRCSGGASCVRYAMVRGHAAPGSFITIDVHGGAYTYQVEFRARSGVEAYPIRLDRLWFSPLVGSDPAVKVITPGFVAGTIGLRTGGNLY